MPPCGGGSSTNCFQWTGGYAQGATSITVANVGSSGISKGDIIVLDHSDDTWHIYHHGCAPNLTADIIWFPTYLVADPVALLDKTASLLRTGWLGDTDYADFIHKIVRAQEEP